MKSHGMDDKNRNKRRRVDSNRGCVALKALSANRPELRAYISLFHPGPRACSFTVMPPGFLGLLPPPLPPAAVDTTSPHPFRGYWALGNGGLSENQDVPCSLKLPLR